MAEADQPGLAVPGLPLGGDPAALAILGRVSLAL
jgi:hypothetical protein